ncbi:hypothetical protein AX15_004249 [Amanita polypyramis BW_CC]|nr:hypothetical protein AX15_004249 [Amanita polypyramis BW_CC]
MPRKARIHLVPLHSSLVNLPMSMYGPLVERDVRPQSLAVHLKLVSSRQREEVPNVEAYVGWTGMGATSSLVHSSKSQVDGVSDTIEIDPQYAQGLGFGQHDVVEVGLLYDLPFAKSVGTEPLTSDDWEIIEIHASHVESILLSQVRVAKIGQEIDVWVLGRTRVRLRVVSLDPPSKRDAQLLTTSTEVAIKPKAHPKAPTGKHPNGMATPSDVPSQKPPMQTKQKDQPMFLMRVIPKRLLPITIPEDSGPEVVTYISPQTFDRLRSLANKNDNKCLVGKLVKLDPPADPSAPAPPVPSAPTPTTRVLNPGGKGKDEEETGDTKAVRKVYISRLNGVLEGHLFIPLPHENIEEWDVVCLMTEPDNANDKSRPLLPEVDTVVTSTVQQQDLSLAGVDDILNDCLSFCRTTFIAHSLTNDVRGAPGILITGRAGSGKTSISQTVARVLQEDQKTLTYIHYVDVSRYSEKPVSTIYGMFKYWFQKVAWHRPAVLILDNLDQLLSAEVEHRNSFRSRQLTELFIHIFSPAARSFAHNFRGILLFATATSKNSLHTLISSSHIFQEVINIPPPSKQARRDILAKVVNERLLVAQDIKEDPESPLNFTALSVQTEGYTVMDLRDIVSRAFHQTAVRLAGGSLPNYLTADDFAKAQIDFVPLSLRDIPLQKSDVVWADIGGLYETRRTLRETLEWPAKYGPIFAQSPLRLRSGLLLYGFPGCGKTLLASAVAKECGLHFISVKGPELLNKYIGASERSVRDLFERAVAAKPCVLFFDEFDSIAPKRGHDSTGVTDRVVNQLLTQMDGAEGLDGVYVLAATSRPDLIDPALLRPGRLDKALICDMPNREERTDILKAISRKVSMSSEIDLEEIAAATEGYSGADLQALLYNAHLAVVHDSIDVESSLGQSIRMNEEIAIEYVAFGPAANTVKSKEEEMALQTRLRQIRKSKQPVTSKTNIKKTIKMHEIKGEHIRKVLETARPSVSPEERQRLGQIYEAFVSNRSGDLPLPPDNQPVSKIMADYHGPGTDVLAINRIESLVGSFLEKLTLQSSQLTQVSRNKGSEGENSGAGILRNKIRLELVNRTKRASTKCLIYPRKAAGGSARSFAQLFRMLDLSHEAVIADEPMTKRELFYRDVALFKSQRVVDQLLDDVTASFLIERRDMNIRASPKGLVCGEGLTICLRDGDEIRANAAGGTLIPVIEDVRLYSVTGDVRWILVVEKEAVFNTLCHLCLVNNPTLPGKGLLITGKGYPDMATRHLVNYLSRTLPLSVPILALVDGDPYGLDILSVYKYGSQSLQHENAKLSADRVEGLGIWTTDMQELGINLSSMLPMTTVDERKAFAMLRRVIPKKWKKELMRMIYTRRKAEIEILTMRLDASGRIGHSSFILYLAQRITHAIRRLES